jgi:succinate dehydrogenase hydrophobic anchor subunit
MPAFLFSSERSAISLTLLLLPPALVIYVVGIVFYRLVLHPLAKYPGPHLAAATKWWRTYKDCIEAWSFVHGIEKLHEIYGDVVRVGPNEVCERIWFNGIV